ncbi:MAG: TolC family protein, partial [Bryobacteraceae bacterium]
MKLKSLLMLWSVSCFGQQALSVQDAVSAALQHNPAIQASGAAIRAASERAKGASAGYLPKLNYSESWTRSDNPVFVFSSLLTQHQFSETNFQIGPLNRPAFLNNFQSVVSVDQSVYDGGATRAAVKAAAAAGDMASESDQQTRLRLALRVTQAYYDALLAAEGRTVAAAAVRSADADLARAESVRNAGMSTDADVLSIRVHLAQMREQEIRRKLEAEMTLASLNEAIGLPLDTRHVLTTKLSPITLPAGSLDGYEARAIEARPELKQARSGTRIADAQTEAAKAAIAMPLSCSSFCVIRIS